MKFVAQKKRELAVIGIMAAVVLTMFVAYAVSAANNNSGLSGQIAKGSNISILSAQVSNGTETLPCKYTPETWACSIPSTEDGHDLTTTLLVKNEGNHTSLAYAISNVVKGSKDGTLIDQDSVSTLRPGAICNISIIFAVSPHALGGQLIEVNSTVF